MPESSIPYSIDLFLAELPGTQGLDPKHAKEVILYFAKCVNLYGSPHFWQPDRMTQQPSNFFKSASDMGLLGVRLADKNIEGIVVVTNYGLTVKRRLSEILY